MGTLAQVDTQREALRQRSVADIINSENLRSEMALRALQGNQVAAQTARVQALQPFVAPTAQAELEATRAQTALTQAGVRQRGAELPFVAPAARANIAATQAATARTELQNQIERALAPMRPEELRSAINTRVQANRLTSDQANELEQLMGTNIAAAKRKLAELDVESQAYTYPDPLRPGQTVTITGRNAPAYIENNVRTAAAAAQHAQQMAEAQRRAVLDETKTDVERATKAASVEGMLRNPTNDKGRPIADRSSIVPYTTEFAALSNSPYAYVPVKPDAKTGVPQDYERFDLPIDPGDATHPPTQLTARDVYQLATSAHMTIRQYLDWYYLNRLRQQPPWQGR